ncbi:MAG: hypothetical protein ACM3JJ_00455 [Hyphomicrobiales bacterium]
MSAAVVSAALALALGSGTAYAAPRIDAPAAFSTVAGLGFSIAATITCSEPADSAFVMVSDLPDGLRLTSGRIRPGVVLATVAGIAPTTRRRISVTWTAIDSHGRASRSTTKLSIVEPSGRIVDLRARATRLVRGKYEFGVPAREARELGPGALPYFLEALRDTSAKRSWPNAVAAAGFLGLLAGYDSLRDFIWNRFQGEVDGAEFKALLYAQAVLGVVEAGRPETFQYLVESSDPGYWSEIPWSNGVLHGREIGLLMSGKSIYALSLIPEARATLALERLRDHPFDPRQRDYVSEALQRRGSIIRDGWLAVREAHQRSNGSTAVERSHHD